MPPVRYHSGAFPPSNLDWLQLVPLLGPASAALARYDGVLSAIPNPQVLLSPLTTQEAVLSSRIEGTVATMTEVLEYEAEAGPDESDQPCKRVGPALQAATNQGLLLQNPRSGPVTRR